MNVIRNSLGALFLIALIGAAGAMGTNVAEYLAPTKADLDRDEKTQLANLCNADGWPEDAAAAYKLACHRELRHGN